MTTKRDGCATLRSLWVNRELKRVPSLRFGKVALLLITRKQVNTSELKNVSLIRVAKLIPSHFKFRVHHLFSDLRIAKYCESSNLQRRNSNNRSQRSLLLESIM